MNVNPWQAEGVSILPSDLKDLIPIVGQQDLFQSLCGFRDETMVRGAAALSGFFVLIGGWGVGKSRVGHEVCLEAVTDDAQWIIDGQPERVLKAGLTDGILPVFVRYSQVTTGPFGEALSTDNWIPSVAVEALSRLAGIRGRDEVNRLSKNQTRLIDLTQKALGPRRRGWGAVLPALQSALRNASTEIALRNALRILQEEFVIENLWFVVDEIEDITDTERDGLPSDDRGKGIDPALLTVIPRVIKQEEIRQEFPQVNFLLLCSMAVGDLMRGIPAIRRRTRWQELTSNAFHDVEAFFRYLKQCRPTVASAMELYPEGLKEAAFFAANRNFGWFNVIMYHAHQNHGALDAPGLLKKFAQEPSRGLPNTVFDLDAISEYQIPRDTDFLDAERLIFGLLPKPIGEGEGSVPAPLASRLFAKSLVSGKKLFTRVVEIDPPAPHLITAHMVSSGFRNPQGTILERPGEARFDIQKVMESLRAYSITLPQDRRSHLLICEQEEEFTEQVRSISPYASEAEYFAVPLHRFLMLSYTQAKAQGEAGGEFIAPAFSFMRRFHALNRLRAAESGYLRDGRKNTALEEAYRKIINDPVKNWQAFARGLAFAWEKAPTERGMPDVEFPSGFNSPCARFSSRQRPLSLGSEGLVTLLNVAVLDENKLREDLSRIAREPRHPVLILTPRELAEQVTARLEKLADALAPFTIIHALAQHETEVLQRFGLMDQVYEPNETRTTYFSGWIETSRQNLLQNAEAWHKNLEEQGLVLRPLFHYRNAKHEEIRAFAQGYSMMIAGASFDKVLQSLSAAEADLFNKGKKRHMELAPKFERYPTLGLLADESGSIVAFIPRALVAVAERCGSLALSRNELEQYFLYETHEDTPARDVINQIALFLVYCGLLEIQNDKFARVTPKALDDQLKRAEDWLGREFENAAQEIEAVHRDAAETLRDLHAKVARQRLKDARKLLEALSLDFLKSRWDELNKPGSDGQPIYAGRFKAAVEIIISVRTAIRSVFDSEAAKAFAYSPDLLPEYESEGARTDYPLWRRVAILRRLYQDVKDRRQALLNRMQNVRQEVSGRVPRNASGDAIFPVQALTRPLDLYERELRFPADKPNQTVQSLGTALGIATIGFKLVRGEYRAALQRLSDIEAELTSPGKLVTTFFSALGEWENIRRDATSLARAVEALMKFFEDANQQTRIRFQLKKLDDDLAALRGIAEEGVMREQTDFREASGVSPFDLASKLAGDVEQIKPLVGLLRSQIDAVESSILVRLKEDLNEKHKALLSAWQRVRQAKSQPPVALPTIRAATWGATEKLFDDLVQEAETEGGSYLPAECPTTFKDLVDLCQLELDGKEIDWSAPPYKGHVEVLMIKRLLRLKLI